MQQPNRSFNPDAPQTARRLIQALGVSPQMKYLTICILTLIALLLVTVPAVAEDNAPASGSFGFNWLAPESASCKKLSVKDLPNTTICRFEIDVFNLPGHVCKVNEHVELMVYKTATQCKKALGVMEANAP